MEINIRQLPIAYVVHVKRVADDEEWVYIPGAKDYALSTHGRLHRKGEDGRWHKVHRQFDKRAREVYPIVYDGKPEEKSVRIETLIIQTFFRGEKPYGIYNYEHPSGKADLASNERWDISKLAFLSKQEYVELLLRKMQGLTVEKEENQILRMTDNIETRKFIDTKVCNMHRRACNENYKTYHPLNRDTTMDEDWVEHPIHAKEYLSKIIYWYPEPLIVDKDLMTFGLGNRYAPGTVALLPHKYNNVFCRGTSRLGYCIKEDNGRFIVQGCMHRATKNIPFEKYSDALQKARELKAGYIRSMIDAERELGYMPEYLLQQMELWASRCEHGELEVWEPKKEVLQAYT